MFKIFITKRKYFWPNGTGRENNNEVTVESGDTRNFAVENLTISCFTTRKINNFRSNRSINII